MMLYDILKAQIVAEPIVTGSALIGVGYFIIWQARTLVEVRDDGRDRKHEAKAILEKLERTSDEVARHTGKLDDHGNRINTLEWHVEKTLSRIPLPDTHDRDGS